MWSTGAHSLVCRQSSALIIKEVCVAGAGKGVPIRLNPGELLEGHEP